jgi:hypothetical protein
MVKNFLTSKDPFHRHMRVKEALAKPVLIKCRL